MATTICVVCNTENSGMIAIYRHPKRLDLMLHFICDHEANESDYLCIDCYDEMKVAVAFKQKCVVSNLIRVPEVVNEIPVTSANENSTYSSCEDERQDYEEDSPQDAIEIEENKPQINDIERADELETIVLQSTDEDSHSTTNTPKSSAKKRRKKSEKSLTETPGGTKYFPVAENDDPYYNLTANQCEYCFTKCPKAADLKKHIKSHKKEDDPYRCFHKDCVECFTHRWKVRAHLDKIHSGAVPDETKKGKRRTRSSVVKSSNVGKKFKKFQADEEKQYACPTCNLPFKSQDALNEHEDTHHRQVFKREPLPMVYEFWCPACGLKFDTTDGLAAHESSVHSITRYKCKFCSSAFMSREQLDKHAAIHS